MDLPLDGKTKIIKIQNLSPKKWIFKIKIELNYIFFQHIFLKKKLIQFNFDFKNPKQIGFL
jgi:hypothetical protein